MRNLITICLVSTLLALSGNLYGEYLVTDDFETSWTGDYAPGWAPEGYRHDDGSGAPIAIMEQVDLTGTGRTGYGLKLIADWAPTYTWGDPWWAIVNNAPDETSMLKQYDPWLSVDYYDAGYTSGTDATGQLYALPSHTYEDDWTDVQFGGRTTAESQYYFVAAGSGHPGWQETGVSRPDLDDSGTAGWVNFKMQLSSADGKIHFYINGSEVGSSYRSDYLDLGTPMLNVNYDTPLSDWGENSPSVIYDNFQYGSSIPEPATMVLLGLGGLLLRKRK